MEKKKGKYQLEERRF